MDWDRIVANLHTSEVLAACIGGVLVLVSSLAVAYFQWIRPRRLASLEEKKIPCSVNSFKAISRHSLPRRDLLRDIFQKLTKNSPLVLTGLGGIGKTQIALMYAQDYAAKYACRWWVDASSEQSILEAYREFAVRNLKMQNTLEPEKYLEPVKQWMREHKRWLFVFDNADDLKDKQKWVPVGLTGMRHVLFTSRAGNWDGVADVLPVVLFTEEEARDYFAKAAGRNDDGSLDALIAALGYLPLAMAQAAAYIRVDWKNHPEKGYKDYLESFTQSTKKMLQKYPTAEVDKRVVYATWDISMEKIKNAKESAWQLLHIMAFFAPDGIQREWFTQGQEALPKPLQHEIGNELQWGEIRNALTEHSLVEESEGGALGMHRLVGEVVRDKLRETGDFETYAGYAVGVGAKLCIDDFPTRESRDAFEKLYPHSASIAENATLRDQDAQVARLCSFLGLGASIVWGNYNLALEWHEKALAINEKVLGKAHPNTAVTYNNIAIIYYKKGEYDRALEWYKKALAISENVLGKKHPDTAATYNNIALAYDDKGEYDLALEWYEKALAIKENVLGKEHPDTAATYNNIANVYDDKGEYDRALEWYEKALAIKENVFGKEHPDTTGTYNNMAIAYCKKGEYDRALELLENALTVWGKVLGENHPNTLLVRNNIAKCKRMMQN